MLSINFDQVIPSIVEAMLPRFSPKDIALAITLDLRDTDYSEDHKEDSTATICRFLFHRPSNYTKVLVNYNFNNFHDDVYPQCTPLRYEKHSDHDSCWRSDGLRILSTHWQNVQDHFNKHPKDISQFYSFSIFDSIKYVRLIKFDAIKQKEDNWIRAYSVQYSPITFNETSLSKLFDNKQK
jgi:ribosomal protein S15P/S13E